MRNKFIIVYENEALLTSLNGFFSDYDIQIQNCASLPDALKDIHLRNESNSDTVTGYFVNLESIDSSNYNELTALKYPVVTFYFENSLNAFRLSSNDPRNYNDDEEFDFKGFYNFFKKKSAVLELFANNTKSVQITYEDIERNPSSQEFLVMSFLLGTSNCKDKKNRWKLAENFVASANFQNGSLEDFFTNGCRRFFRYSSIWHRNAESYFREFLSRYINKPVHFLEIGTHEGRSAIWMLENILTHDNSSLVCIDLADKSYANQLYSNLTFKQHMSKCKIYPDYSQNVLRRFPSEKFDFIYIDGSHAAVDVLQDGIESFRLLRKGGIMAFDDYTFKCRRKLVAGQTQMKFAIDSFINLYEDAIEVLIKDRQVWLQKT